MAVTVKSTNYSFIEKLGVDPGLISGLKVNKIKLIIGFYDIILNTEDGKQLALCHLPDNCNNLAKNKTSAEVKKQSIAAIEKSIIEAIAFLDSGEALSIPLSAMTGMKVAENVVINTAPAQIQTQPPVNAIAPAQLIKAPPVVLAHANQIFQPVKGSSKGSRYFVVAIAPTVKVAAKIHGGSVSIRVEGTLSQQVIEAFNKVEIKNNGNLYLSGHFECGPNVTPERLIGAVIFGSGLSFSSNIPSLNLIKDLK